MSGSSLDGTMDKNFPEHLNERARNRLKLAAGFLRKEGYKFDDGPFYDKVIETIASLPAERKNRLQELVDWVEQFEG